MSGIQSIDRTSSTTSSTLSEPVLLDQPSPNLRAHPYETVVAEKFPAMVNLGRANGRMKDFYISRPRQSLMNSRMARSRAPLLRRSLGEKQRYRPPRRMRSVRPSRKIRPSFNSGTHSFRMSPLTRDQWRTW
ncbi:nucleotidyl transferase AbiEii/AbiGii toxin family protein [Bradyrhizobium sp. CCGUVB4N]|uniref:nucleotidyl transferase AbiEii/AbiGii toxin family protein n=1 Tax=Bradyrhizobium sp. CCGUVB4N TaxID=2949631 RepID=UPI0035C6F42F